MARGVEISSLGRIRAIDPFQKDMTLENERAREVPRFKEVGLKGPTVAGQVRRGQLPADCPEQGGEDPDGVGRA